MEPTPSSISLNFSLNFALRRRGRYGYFPLFGRKTPASRRYYGAKVAIIFQISNFQGQNLDRCDRHRNRLNPSPNKLSADFICRRSKLFRVESLDKGYSDCLYLSRQIRFSTDGLRIFPTFSTIATILLSGNYPDFSISINILSKLFQHEPHLSHPCDPGARRRVWLHDPHRYRRPHPREIVLLPAAWLPPIRLKEVEGRLHGRATYSVELRLLHPGAKLSSERRNEVWSQTELQLFDLFTQLSTDPRS